MVFILHCLWPNFWYWLEMPWNHEKNWQQQKVFERRMTKNWMKKRHIMNPEGFWQFSPVLFWATSPQPWFWTCTMSSLHCTYHHTTQHWEILPGAPPFRRKTLVCYELSFYYAYKVFCSYRNTMVWSLKTKP